MAALQMAEAWGVPPWEVMEHPGGIVWAARWALYEQQKARVREAQAEDARRGN